MTRQDPHCVSNFDPDDYTYESSMSIVEVPDFESNFLIKLGDQACQMLVEQRNVLVQKRKEWLERIDRQGFQQGNFVNKRTCDHCGAWIKYGECYLHTPTEQLIVVGWQCAEKRFSKDWGCEEIEEIKKQVKGIEAYGEKARRIRATLDQHENLEVYLRYDKHEIVRSIKTTLITYGKLTDKQIKTVFRAVDEKWEDKAPGDYPEEATPNETLVGGQRLVEGLVIGAKKKDTKFGFVWKMMVRQLDGNKIYGTIPQNLLVEAEMEEVSIKGCQVKFVAKVKVVKDHFGYFGRPKQAEIVTLSERKT